MGKHLQDTKLNKSDVINNLTTTDSSKALSASQGKVLNDKILAIGNAYRVKGSKTNLSEVLSITNAKVGDVWNITTEFTLHGKPFPASTNLVCITDTSESDHDEDNWDPLGGTVDLTPYATKSEVSNTYATKSEVAETYATKEEVEENEKVTAESLVDLNSKLEDNETKIDTHISNKSNPHSVTKAQIGLGNVDNTSDANKPISNATKTELDKKIQTVSITGSGNAITNATISGTTLTLSKEATYNNYTLPKSTTTALGGIMIGYAENGKNYPIELDSSGKAFVNIPWTDTKTTVDSSLSSTSTNPVQNKVIYTALSGKANTSHTHTKSNITDLNTSLSNDTDLNNIKEVGWYYSIDSNTISNKPSDITAFGLEVIRSANGCYSQTCYSSNSNKIYYRYYNGTSWGSWNKIYTAGDKPTAAEIGAASSNHTHNYAGSSSPGGTATSAAKVNNSLILKIASGTTEGTDIYTFNGSTGKTLDIKAGSNITLTPAANSLTISSKDTIYTHPTNSGNKHIPSGGSSGQILRWGSDGTAVWGNDNNTTYSQATSSTLGLVKIGFTASGKSYPVELNSSGQMYVNVPWTDNNTQYSVASNTSLGLVKIGYAENGKNYPVELDSENKMYVNVPWVDTNTVPQFQIYAGTTDITNNTNAAGFSGTPKLKLNTDSNEQHAILFQGGAGVNVTIGGDGTNKYIQAGINSSTFKSSIVPTIFTGAISGLIDTNLTSSRALISNTSGKISASSVTSTQLGYLNGVTSSIQTQLNTIKANCIYRGVCFTSASTAAKTVSVDGDFTLTAGVFVAIRFEHMNAASNPTLNVNNTGAKAIFYRGAAWKTSQDPARQFDTILMTYDGTQWMISALLEPNKVNFSNTSSTLRAKNFNLDTSTSSNGTITRTSGIQDLYFDSDILSTTSGLFPHSSNSNACITVKTNSGNYYHQIGLSSNKKMYARSFQNVVPNSTTSWYTIPYCEDSQDWTGYQDFQSGAGNTGSDMRFKEKKNEEIDNILPDLMNLKVFEYIWRKEGEREKDTFGVSANQLLEFGGVFEKIVHEREDKEKTKWVEYDRIGVLTLKGLQETNKKLEEKCKKYESALKILGEKLGIDLNDLLDNNED